MPFYPTTKTEIRENVIVWWFSGDFSQAKLDETTTGSNACTIIALLVAHLCFQNNIKILHVENFICQDIVDALGESIVFGNEIYRYLFNQGSLEHASLSVPEAIQAAGTVLSLISEWKSLVYLLDLRESLFENLHESVEEWYSNVPSQCDSDLFVILIAENRSVLLIFQRDIERVTLVDSHQHENQGAVIAQVPFTHLFSLCAWYSDMMEACYGARPQHYELTFLYFRKYNAARAHVFCTQENV